MRGPAIATAALLMSGAAGAADLENRDAREYKVRLIDGPATSHTTISANTYRASICMECRIEVEGAGSVDAEGVARVVIEDGMLRTE